MVLFDPGSRIPLRKFGILIPVAANRSERVLEELRRSPVLAGRDEDEWHLTSDGTELSRADIERVHAPEYAQRLFSDGLEQVILEVFELIDDDGLPYRYDPASATHPLSELFQGTLHWTARTYQAGREALARGFCYHLGGGAHHAHYRFGHGFCVVNDSVVAIRRLQAEQRIATAWVIDVDAHKGDGTAALTADDPSIVTLSVHMASGWPLDLPRYDKNGAEHPSFTPSDIDVPIESGEEGVYLTRLSDALDRLWEYPRPDLVYVIGGMDPYEHDGLPSTQGLRLTLEQLLERDRTIFDRLRAAGLPQAWLMAGGYGERAWEPYVPFLEYALAETLNHESSFDHE